MNQYVIYVLLNIINSAIYDETTRDIAKDILLNFNKIPSLSLDDCANLLHISISTLNRFCKKIGFYNYSTFREDCKNRDFESEMNNFFPTHELPMNYSELNSCLQYIETIELDAFINKLYLAKSIYFLGMDFQFQFLHFQQGMMVKQKYVQLCMPMDTLPSLNDNDLLIVLSMNGKTVRPLLNQIERMNCKKVWITQIEDRNNDFIFNDVIRLKNTNIQSIHKYELGYLFDLILSKYYEKCSKIEQLK